MIVEKVSIRIISVFLIFMWSLTGRLYSQEFNCVVDINTDQIDGTSKSVFETLKLAISDYINTRQWTDMHFAPNEKIECRLFFTIREYSDDRMKGDLQVQLSRPVYNSTYTTTLLNFKDTKVEFSYREGEPLIFNEYGVDNNLTALLNFYAYLMLALDFDSFSLQGGQQWYDKAASIVQNAQSTGEAGWRTFEDNRNRSAVLGAFTDANTNKSRELLYTYHRKGLDEMSSSPDKGRAAITASLSILENIYNSAPMSIALNLFRDSKMDELVGIYSKAPKTEKENVYKLLSKLYPSETTRLEKIRNTSSR